MDTQVLGVQVLHLFDEQISPGAQVPLVPHVSFVPHPSSIVPQLSPKDSQVFGVHDLQTLERQASPDGQGVVPHVSFPPQPSETVPQL
jgi:hypothetical protein